MSMNPMQMLQPQGQPSINAGQQQQPFPLAQPDAQLNQSAQMQMMQQGTPAYDQTITQILQAIGLLIQNAGPTGNNLGFKDMAQGVAHLAQSAHLLAQAAQQEGQHVPVVEQIRDMNERRQADIAVQAHQQELQQQDQQHRHQLEREMQAAKIAQLAHSALLDEHAHDNAQQQQQEQHEQDLALAEQQAQQQQDQQSGGEE